VTHEHCTDGDTTRSGLISPPPYTTDPHFDGLTTIYDLQPKWALGISHEGYTTIYDRTTDTPTVLATPYGAPQTLDISIGSRNDLASDIGAHRP
jgi:hypothetical protein